MRHAIALAHYRNFARAARALHVTQPTMSRSIAALERTLGVRLFDRNSRSVQPTEFGRLLLERGRRLLADEADLRREMLLVAGLETGHLVVSAGPWPFEISVGTAVTRLLAAHPNLRVHARLSDPHDVGGEVRAGRADVGLVDVRFLGTDQDLLVDRLPSHGVIVACRPDHPLTKRVELQLADVMSFPIASTIIADESVNAMTSVVASLKSGEDVRLGELAPAIYVNSYDLARRIARSTDALVPGALNMLEDDIEAGRLVRLNVDLPAVRTQYALICRRDRSPSPAATAFMDLIRTVEAEVTAKEAVAGRIKRTPVRRPRSRRR